MPKLEMEILNEKGLHARASAKFSETVERFNAKAVVRRDSLEATGDSIMGLLMLAAGRGAMIEVETWGAEAEELMSAISSLVAGLFGEER